MLFKTLLAIVALIGLQSQAQTLKVVKVKGKRAIVETVDGNITQGQTLKVGGGGSDDLDFPDSTSSGKSGGAAGQTGPRNNFIGGSASYSSAKTPGSSTTTSVMSASAYYGWNPGNKMEYGAILNAGSVSGGGSSSTSFAAGGKFDYDFTNNKAPVDGILSAGAEATYGQAGSGGQNYSQISVFPMASYKWFILKTPTCVRADAGFKFTQTSGGSGGSSTDSGLAVQVGLFTYFGGF